MDAKQLIDDMKTTIIKAKDEGLGPFSIADLESWVMNLESLTKKSLSTEERNIELTKWVEDYKSYKASKIEVLKAVFEFGGAALKSAILINGGASVALLAFIGKIWDGKSNPIVQNLSCSLIIFVVGVASSGLASGTAYISQSYYADRKNETGHTWRGITAGLIIFSYILFFSGAFTAYSTFIQ